MGGSVLIIVFILISGFAYNRLNKFRYFKLLDYDGQHLYNKLLVNGACFFIFAILTCLGFRLVDLFWLNIASSVSPFLRSINFLGSSVSNTVLLALIISLLSSVILALVHDEFSYRWWKQFVQDENEFENAVTREDFRTYLLLNNISQNHPVKNQIISALLDAQLLMIFMDDRKVYIGKIRQIQFSSDFKEDMTHFALSPAKSGYREKDTLEVNITTDYKSKNLNVLLKVDDVISIRPYSQDQFDHFTAQKKEVVKAKEAKERRVTRLPARMHSRATEKK